MKLLTALSVSAILLLAIPTLKAQDLFMPGSRSQSLAGISASLADCWSVFGNQAGIAQIDRPIIGGSFQNKFLVKELSISAGLLIVPVRSTVFAFSVYQFGKTFFRQEKYGVAFARSLNPRLHFGLQFNYYRFFLAEDNRSIGSYGLELGFQYQLTNRLYLGIHSLNPYKTSIGTFSGEYFYPSRLNFGASYQLSTSFGLVTEIEKDLDYPLKFKGGLEYNVMNNLFVRTGISGKPFQLAAGMGFAVKKMKIDWAVAYNQYLGNSPSVTFQYLF